MQNALTIDVEDWYHVCNCDRIPEILPGVRRVRQNLDLILALLAAFDVKATFFVLGALAAEEPTMVPSIVGAGHEVSSHGYSHTLIPRLGPEQFRDELRRTEQVIGMQGGVKPLGFRAPQWSMGVQTRWAMDILQEEGYVYDSSCNPLPFVGDRHGHRTPFLIETSTGHLVEMPPMVTPSPLGNLPTGGGWGFRLFPLWLIRRTITQLNDAGMPAVVYLHPREMDAGSPRLSLPPLKSFAAYGPRSDAAGRLRELLAHFTFCPLGQLVTKWQSA